MPALEEEFAVLGRRLVTRSLLGLAASAVNLCHDAGPRWLRLAFVGTGAAVGAFYMAGAFVCAVFPLLAPAADTEHEE
jgi:hypothetical protein